MRSSSHRSLVAAPGPPCPPASRNHAGVSIPCSSGQNACAILETPSPAGRRIRPLAAGPSQARPVACAPTRLPPAAASYRPGSHGGTPACGEVAAGGSRPAARVLQGHMFEGSARSWRQGRLYFGRCAARPLLCRAADAEESGCGQKGGPKEPRWRWKLRTPKPSRKVATDEPAPWRSSARSLDC